MDSEVIVNVAADEHVHSQGPGQSADALDVTDDADAGCNEDGGSGCIGASAEESGHPAEEGPVPLLVVPDDSAAAN
jgi:hypothetical protein